MEAPTYSTLYGQEVNGVVCFRHLCYYQQFLWKLRWEIRQRTVRCLAHPGRDWCVEHAYDFLVKKKDLEQTSAEKPKVFDAADIGSFYEQCHNVLSALRLHPRRWTTVGSNRLELQAGVGGIYKGDSIKHHWESLENNTLVLFKPHKRKFRLSGLVSDPLLSCFYLFSTESTISWKYPFRSPS